MPYACERYFNLVGFLLGERCSALNIESTLDKRLVSAIQGVRFYCLRDYLL